MNKRLLRRYAEEVIGENLNEEILEKVFEITLYELEKYRLYNYNIKSFMKHLYELYEKEGIS